MNFNSRTFKILSKVKHDLEEKRPVSKETLSCLEDRSASEVLSQDQFFSSDSPTHYMAQEDQKKIKIISYSIVKPFTETAIQQFRTEANDIPIDNENKKFNGFEGSEINFNKKQWFGNHSLSPIITNETNKNSMDLIKNTIIEHNEFDNYEINTEDDSYRTIENKVDNGKESCHISTTNSDNIEYEQSFLTEKNIVNEETKLSLSNPLGKTLSDNEVEFLSDISSSEEDPYANSEEDSLYIPSDEENTNSFHTNLKHLYLKKPRKIITRFMSKATKVDKNKGTSFIQYDSSLANTLKKNYEHKTLRVGENSLTTLNPKHEKDENDGNGKNILISSEIAKKNIYKRKPDFCYYCEDEVLNFSRHVQRNHSTELEVVKIFSNPPKSKERRRLLDGLRRKGNYLKNAEECFKPVRKSYIPNRSLLPCDNCLGFFSSKLLYRHRKKCGGSSSTSQASGQTLLYCPSKTDRRLKEEVFPNMRADNISIAVKKDVLICAFGARYLKMHRDKHFVNVTSRIMRELGRLLLEIRKREPSICNLFQALKPKYFDIIVESTKAVANYDPVKDIFGSPTYAMNIVNSLKQCCDIAITFALKKGGDYGTITSAEAEVELKTMIHLLTSNWKYEISSQAASNLALNKWNKTSMVPLATDLKLLRNYLLQLADMSVKKLKEDPNDISAYNSLLETVFCRVILLNRKRPGELQRMQLHTYSSTSQAKNHYEEFNDVISPTEQILLKTLRRVVIRGKRGRGVPVLFSADVQEHIDLLIQMRSTFVPANNIYLFGKPNLTTPISGYKVLQKHVKACGVQNPAAITCTRLRKHLATLSQIFNMTDNELDQLATFMGHTSGVHKSSYRLPDDIYQTAKVSKILLLMENGNASQFKGKALDEIEIDMEENLLEEKETYNEKIQVLPTMDDDCSLDCEDGPLEKEVDTKVEPKMGTKRKLVPWTSEQKKILREFFKNHIKKKKPPKKVECEELRELHRPILDNKNWLKIKVFIQNEYSKKH